MKSVFEHTTFEASYTQEYIQSLQVNGCTVLTASVNYPDRHIASYAAFVVPTDEYLHLLSEYNRNNLESWLADRQKSDPLGFFCRPRPHVVTELPFEAIDDERFVIAATEVDAVLRSAEVAKRVQEVRHATQSSSPIRLSF